MQESMGPIADRTKENLVSTDNAIIMARLRLRKAAQAVGEGSAPAGSSRKRRACARHRRAAQGRNSSKPPPTR